MGRRPVRCGGQVVQVRPKRGGSFSLTLVGAVPRAEIWLPRGSPSVPTWRVGTGEGGRSQPGASSRCRVSVDLLVDYFDLFDLFCEDRAPRRRHAVTGHHYRRVLHPYLNNTYGLSYPWEVVTLRSGFAATDRSDRKQSFI
eukprot:SAG11_NODE_6417_length_1318_cov_2.273995_2_plen_141_part_00